VKVFPEVGYHDMFTNRIDTTVVPVTFEFRR
jgi:hypothetical protein